VKVIDVEMNDIKFILGDVLDHLIERHELMRDLVDAIGVKAQ
jgi:hypothetical protein